jgi:D-beta-D-heptose 7-phosphate kinase/D-beta-D-heptose 1-phosphate adenosyltransferase
MGDDDIRSKKGADRPIMNLKERLAMMAAVRFVDHVAVLSQPNCLAAIEALRPDYFFKSLADRTRRIVLEEMKLVESLGGRVVLFPEDEPPPTSTTRIIDVIRGRSGGVPYGS